MYYAWLHGGYVLWEGHSMGWLGISLWCLGVILHINKLANPHHTISSIHPRHLLCYYPCPSLCIFPHSILSLFFFPFICQWYPIIHSITASWILNQYLLIVVPNLFTTLLAFVKPSRSQAKRWKIIPCHAVVIQIPRSTCVKSKVGNKPRENFMSLCTHPLFCINTDDPLFTRNKSRLLRTLTDLFLNRRRRQHEQQPSCWHSQTYTVDLKDDDSSDINSRPIKKLKRQHKPHAENWWAVSSVPASAFWWLYVSFSKDTLEVHLFSLCVVISPFMFDVDISSHPHPHTFLLHKKSCSSSFALHAWSIISSFSHHY